MDRINRQKTVFTLRNQGLSFENIAKQIDPEYRRSHGEVYTPEMAYEDYRLHMAVSKDLYNESEDTQRAMMSQRLTQLWEAVQKDLNAGRGAAIDQALRIIDRQMKLYGLEKTRSVPLQLQLEEIVDDIMRRTNTPPEKRGDIIRMAERILADEQRRQDTPRSGMSKRDTKD